MICYKKGLLLRLCGVGAMSVRIVLRCAVPFSLALFVSGCVGPAPQSRRAVTPTSECYHNRAACDYEGAYEPGEAGYAEQEAKRLNQAEIQKLRRGW